MNGIAMFGNRVSTATAWMLLSLIGAGTAATAVAAPRARSNTRAGWVARRVEAVESTPSISSDTPTVYDDGFRASTVFVGPRRVVDDIAERRATPRSLASADFDGDGVADLACGYAVDDHGGAVAILSGNPLAIYPGARATLDGDPSPFRPQARVVETSLAAELLVAGDFTGDGRADLAVSHRGADAFVVLEGDGRGNFSPRDVGLSGALTALAAGEFGRPDGVSDLVACVAGWSVPKALVFERIADRAPASALEIALPSSAQSAGFDGEGESLSRLVLRCGGARVVASPDGATQTTALAGEPGVALAPGMRALWRTDSPGFAVQSTRFSPTVRFTTESTPAAVLAMRLNPDARPDLVVLDDGSPLPSVVRSAARATFVVTNTADSGPGSLRDAIFAAGATPEIDTITFNIPGAAPHTIRPATPLPALFDPMTIDATTEPGYAGTPVVEIDCSATTDSAGISISVDTVVLRGLAINRADGPGVSIFQGGGHIIEACVFGADPTGTIKRPNATDGIYIGESTDNVIGGTTAAARNVLSGNRGSGVAIGSGTTGTIVRGNIIGLDASGAAALGNDENGVLIVDAATTTVGGATTTARNVISGNGALGVGVFGEGSVGAVVQGNFIGLDSTGASPIGNGGDGVYLLEADGVVVGGATAAARNVISANGANGVGMTDPATRDATILGNYIGTNAAGTAAFGNVGNGVYLEGSANVQIGGATTGAGNLISGNLSLGIGIFNSATSNRIQGNTIGEGATGGALGNAADGIYIEQSTGTLIGGAGPGEGNRIASNGAAGIRIFSGERHTMSRNSIEANNWLAIDLGEGGVKPNDDGDADSGANGLLNVPVLTTVDAISGGTLVRGVYSSRPGSTFTLEFSSNVVCDPFDNGEAETWFGSLAVTTDSTGVAPFEMTFPAAVAPGAFVTATATDAQGNTSELAECVQVRLAWNPPAAEGGAPQNLTITSAGGLPAPATEGSSTTVVKYNVYRSQVSPVPTTSNNLVASVPASRTSMNLPAKSGGFYVVTAVFASGVESPASNQVSTPGSPDIALITLSPNGKKLTIDGANFTPGATVVVDGLTFSKPAKVSRGTRLVQKGLLSNGMTVGRYLASRPIAPSGQREILVGVRNAAGGVQAVIFSKP